MNGPGGVAERGVQPHAIAAAREVRVRRRARRATAMSSARRRLVEAVRQDPVVLQVAAPRRSGRSSPRRRDRPGWARRSAPRRATRSRRGAARSARRRRRCRCRAMLPSASSAAGLEDDGCRPRPSPRRAARPGATGYAVGSLCPPRFSIGDRRPPARPPSSRGAVDSSASPASSRRNSSASAAPRRPAPAGAPSPRARRGSVVQHARHEEVAAAEIVLARSPAAARRARWRSASAPATAGMWQSWQLCSVA
ncbi:MAG: hypothetical protein MZV64_43270 [Ignavibacteriales bacterium]|nr:hypothetical protein [Ignavibacteriales bacterium]